MASPQLGVADVVRAHGPHFVQSFPTSRDQRRVLTAIACCRTPALGSTAYECDACGARHIVHRSCRNRHCPTCQTCAAAEWYQARAADLLPVGYFHVVFTLPEELRPLALQNKARLYGLLFRAASQTLLEVAANPDNLGAKIGFHAVLHTWGQTLVHHPHLHCVIPGGGLSLDGMSWVPCRKSFFLPIAILRTVFRGKFLEELEHLLLEQKLELHGQLEELADPNNARRLLRTVSRKKWIVYSKPPFAGPDTVLKYLARYTHRIAISNSRIQQLSDDMVRFTYKDYRDENANKQLELSADEFLRRFLMHVLPHQFVRIRHYGILANRVRRARVEQCRALLPPRNTRQQPDDADALPVHADSPSPRSCPACKRGHLFLVAEIPPQPDARLDFYASRSPP